MLRFFSLRPSPYMAAFSPYSFILEPIHENYLD
jgi:hypothetical protein